MTWLDRKLARIVNKSRVNVAVPIVFNLSLCGLVLMFSIQQSFPINEVGSASVLGSGFSEWYNDVCQNRLVNKLSPFLFYMKVAVFDQDVGLLGCPWRIRNTSYRMVVICLMSLILLWMLAILLFNTKKPSKEEPQSKIWKFVCISQYLLFFGMIVVLILDCDGLWNGYRLCQNNFDMNLFESGYGATVHLHDNNILLNLLDIQWRTTMPPWCPKRAIGEGLSTDYENDNFKLVKACYLTPYIYTAVCDFGVVILSYIVFKFASLYLFGTYIDTGNNRREGTRKNSNNNQKGKFRFNFGKTKKKKDSMAEHDGNNSINRPRSVIPMSPAYPIDGTLYDNDYNEPPMKYPPKPPQGAIPANVKQ